MRFLLPVILALCIAGCEGFVETTSTSTPQRVKAPETPATTPEMPGHAPQLRPKAAEPQVFESYATCTFDVITIPRSQVHELDQLFDYTETSGVYGPPEKVLAMNGLRIARSDLRFVDTFNKALAGIQRDSRRLTYVRIIEGKDQVFDVGETYKDLSLFVWTAPDSVMGRHFTQGRYTMTLALDKVPREKVVEYGLSWVVHVGKAFERTVTIPALDVQAELAQGQTLVIAPLGFAGRSVDRAFLSGLQEATERVTFFVITPNDIRRKPEPKPEKTDAAGEAAGTEEKTKP